MGLRRVKSNFVATISSCRCIAAGLEKEKIGWTIRLCSTFTFINGDCICKWILNTLFFNNGLRGEDKV